MSHRRLSRHVNADEIARGAAAWFMRALGNDERAWKIGGPYLPVQRASGSGDFLVPAEIADVIIAFRDLAVFRANASVYSMESDTLDVPRRSSSLTVNFVAEGTALAESKVIWDAIGFAAKKAAAFARLSNELDEDAAPDVGAYLLVDSGTSLGLFEDDCGFNGDGTSPYGGVVGLCPALLDGAHDAGKVFAASGHNTFGSLDASDLTALMQALPDKFWPNAKFFCSGYAAAATFMRLGATTAGTRMTALGLRPQLQFAGIPVVITPKLPGAGDQQGKIMLLFGDLRLAAALGSRRELTLATSGQRYFELDQTAFRVTSRFDITCNDLGDNAAAGAIVGLVGAA